MKELPNSYLVGKVRHIHAGFAVHKVVGRLNKPMERVGPIRESAKAAVEAAEAAEAVAVASPNHAVRDCEDCEANRLQHRAGHSRDLRHD